MLILNLESINDGIEDFIGFYDEKGFWVEEWIDFDDQVERKKLRGIIPEPVIWHHAEKFTAAVCIDGMMLLRMTELAKTRPPICDPDQINQAVQWWDEHMDYANVMQLFIESESIKCLDSGEISFSAVSIANTCRVGFRGGIPVRKSHSNNISLMAARCTSLAMDGARVAHHDIGTWSNFTKVKKATISTALQQFETAVDDPVLIKRLAFIARAKSAYQNHDFRGSFTMLWFVIESVAKELWLLKAKGKNTKKPTMYEILIDLEKDSIISSAQYGAIDDLRDRVRNVLMHQPVTAICLPDDCFKAADSAMQLLRNKVTTPDITLKWNFGVQF